MPSRPQPFDLTAPLVSKPSWTDLQVGLECERLGVFEESGAAVPFSGTRSVSAVLEGLRDRFDWQPVGGPPLLELERRGSRLTLEPGAQVELSGRTNLGLHQARAELAAFLRELRKVSVPLGILWLPLGLQPLSLPEEIPWIPKDRYRVMARYLPTRGRLAPWMMKATAGMQVNLDIRDPEDAALKLRLALRLGSVITALFANSPLSAGSENGWASRRSRIWMEVDPERCGLPEACLRPESTLQDYAAWALEAGMFFVERERKLIDLTGHTFRSFLEEGAREHHPTPEDWHLHLTTLFPEARLKGYLELRGTDSNRLDLTMAHAAFWTGIVYGDAEVKKHALDLSGVWSHADRLRFHRDCARHGLAAVSPDGRTAAEMARELIALSAGSLERTRSEERLLLGPAEEMAERGRSPADELRDAWRGRWRGSVVKMAAELAEHDVT